MFLDNHQNKDNNYGTPDFTDGINSDQEGAEDPILNDDPTYNDDPTFEEPIRDPVIDDPTTMEVPPNVDNPLQAPPNSTREEELATEITADDRREVDRSDDDEGIQANNVMGWIALILSIASYFMMPVILGGAGIILGFIARNRGASTLGNTAIVAGIVSILITLFILPFV